MHHLILPSVAFVFMACAPPEQKFSALRPSVSVAPDALEFGEVVPGLAISRELAVLSSGRATLEITDIRIEPADGAIGLNWTMHMGSMGSTGSSDPRAKGPTASDRWDPLAQRNEWAQAPIGRSMPWARRADGSKDPWTS